MKTPMQELIEYTTDLIHTFDSEERIARAVFDYLKANKKAMLEKEKELMCGIYNNALTGIDKDNIVELCTKDLMEHGIERD